MTPWRARFRVPLYLRIWLAVLLAVTVLTFAFGWLWRVNAENLPPREVIIRSESGDVLGQTRTRPTRDPLQGTEFQVPMSDGSTVVVQFPPRPRSPGEALSRPWWGRGPGGFLWILGIMALAVAIGSYPIIRRLTQRLDDLRQGVERWGEGDLSTRIKESGSDELAFLAERFNHAAERVETLLESHKSLLANASHELRSPLARIRMGLELMEPQTSPAFQDEIRRNIAELDQLIDEILLASRLDAKETDIGTVESVDLTGLAAEECARARRCQAVAARRAQPAGEREAVQRRPSDGRAPARRRRCRRACARSWSRGAARGAGAYFRALLSPGRSQRAFRRRWPGACTGALHHAAPSRLGALRRPGGRRRVLRASRAL